MCGACLCDWVDQVVCNVNRVPLSMELKHCVELGPKLPGVPAAYQAVTLQELCNRVGN